MIKRSFGSTGVDLPVIGQGSWQFSGGRKAVEETQEALKAGIELGMVHIDTAEMYGDAESIIKGAISGLPRSELFIVSKVLPQNASYEGTLTACKRSLSRLGTDYLDCYLLHWRGAHPLAETMAALEKLVDEGSIRFLGVSNFDLDDVKEAEACLQKHKIACNQVLYNLHERGIDRHLLPYCQERQIAVVGYTPFAQRKIPSESGKNGAVLHEIAAKHNATARQIVLAFLVRCDNLFTIPKASQKAHTVENAGAGAIKLSREEIEKINEVFPVPGHDKPLAMI